MVRWVLTLTGSTSQLPWLHRHKVTERICCSTMPTCMWKYIFIYLYGCMYVHVSRYIYMWQYIVTYMAACSPCVSPSVACPCSPVGACVGAAGGGFIGGVLLTAAIATCLACAVFYRIRTNREVTAKREWVCKGFLAPYLRIYIAVNDLLYANME